MKQILVLASTNKGKTRELQERLQGYPVDIKNISDFGPIPEVIEDGETFDDNAYKKASLQQESWDIRPWRTTPGFAWRHLAAHPAYIRPVMPEKTPRTRTMWTNFWSHGK